MEVLIPLGLWVMISVIVVAAVWGSVQNKRTVSDTIKRAIDAGPQLTPEVISALHKPARATAQDLRGGIILIALALGFIIAGVMSLMDKAANEEAMHWAHNGFFFAAIIIGALGVGQLVAALVRRPKDGALMALTRNWRARRNGGRNAPSRASCGGTRASFADSFAG